MHRCKSYSIPMICLVLLIGSRSSTQAVMPGQPPPQLGKQEARLGKPRRSVPITDPSRWSKRFYYTSQSVPIVKSPSGRWSFKYEGPARDDTIYWSNHEDEIPVNRFRLFQGKLEVASEDLSTFKLFQNIANNCAGMFNAEENKLATLLPTNRIEVYDLRLGRAVQKSTYGDDQHIIWSYTFLPDDTLLIVDQKGFAQVNSETGTLMKRGLAPRYLTHGSFRDYWIEEAGKSIWMLEVSTRRK